MMNITPDMIKDSFSERTFYRGLDYYENGYVIGPVILDNTLYARVIGTMETPYEVKAFIDNNEIDTKCTCPVGSKCKHAVALLLNWVHEPSSFTDSNKFITSLNSMSKHEIINIVKKI
ncbi:MAG: SWIM zinc finger family protein, partial [Methanosarcinales archaeon]|nr:SWIM zinc finger family protein [Methanosarcinales archaeon]